jgi:DNA-binding NtrC family response regulator
VHDQRAPCRGSAEAAARPRAPQKKRARTDPALPTLDDARERWLAPLERQYLTELLGRHGGNIKAAAKAAGINTVTLYRLLKRRGLHMGRTVKQG